VDWERPQAPGREGTGFLCGNHKKKGTFYVSKEGSRKEDKEGEIHRESSPKVKGGKQHSFLGEGGGESKARACPQEEQR